MSDVQTLTTTALADIAAATTLEALEALRVALLGKSGRITAQLKSLGTLPPEERKAVGEGINKARDAIGEALAARKAVLEQAALDARLASERIDVTLPGRDGEMGVVHPVSRTIERLTGILRNRGFQYEVPMPTLDLLFAECDMRRVVYAADMARFNDRSAARPSRRCVPSRASCCGSRVLSPPPLPPRASTRGR